MDIKKVVVIGSGTMGSGIAAHLCNANIPVTLLDLTPEISENARDRIFKSKPPVVLDKNVPIVNPIIAVHPKIMDNGNKASATRIWNWRKLIPVNDMTSAIYKAANTVDNARFLLFIMYTLLIWDLYSGSVRGSTRNN